MPFVHQKKWQPGEHEIDAVITAEMAHGNSPERTLQQDVHQTRHSTRLRSGEPLSFRHPFQPGKKPNKAGDSEDNKHRTPAEPCHQRASSKGPYRRSNRHSRGDESIGQATMVL